MSVRIVDLGALAEACETGDLEAFEVQSGRLGWVLTSTGRKAICRAVKHTNPHRDFQFGRIDLPLEEAISVITEAATNDHGVAIVEHQWMRMGKVVGIAFRDDDYVHFGVRYSSNAPRSPSNMWPVLGRWYKKLERNRKRLGRWAEEVEDVVSLPRVEVEEVGDEEVGQRLLAAVIAEPDDVERRLVYADWLVERGDAQGQLIQLCEQRRADQVSNQERNTRIKELQQDYGERLAGEVAQLADDYGIRYGFVDWMTMQARTFDVHGDRLLDQHPVRELRLKTVTNKALRRLGGAEALSRIRRLVIHQDFGRARAVDMDPVCRSPHLDRLKHWEISNCPLAGDIAEAFRVMEAPVLKTLRLRMFDEAVQVVDGLSQNEMVHLHDLHLSWFRDSTVGWGPALRHEAFVDLRRLDVTGLHAAEVDRLLDGAALPRLERLSIRGGVSIDRLVALGAVRHLVVERGTGVDNDDLERLVTTLPLRRFEVFDVKELDLDEAVTFLLSLADDHPLEAVRLGRNLEEPLRKRLEARYARR